MFSHSQTFGLSDSSAIVQCIVNMKHKGPYSFKLVDQMIALLKRPAHNKMFWFSKQSFPYTNSRVSKQITLSHVTNNSTTNIKYHNEISSKY